MALSEPFSQRRTSLIVARAAPKVEYICHWNDLITGTNVKPLVYVRHQFHERALKQNRLTCLTYTTITNVGVYAILSLVIGLVVGAMAGIIVRSRVPRVALSGVLTSIILPSFAKDLVYVILLVRKDSVSQIDSLRIHQGDR